MINQTLGPYKILSQLGKGGMGEVYLAEDSRLGRKVAIKVLPAELAGDADRRSRFEQEARAAAALNHPHIAAIHDVGVETASGESVPTHYMVQEYLQGETLRETIARGTLTREKAFQLGIEITEALKAAHRAKIVHRDLKPDNVFVSTDGHAKVLDFGLAKLTELGGAGGGSMSASPTMTMAGQMLGTAGYMSPEQVRGEEIDERADLFALGCVIYEMITGKQAFGGTNVHESLSRILAGDPDPIDGQRTGPVGQLPWVIAKLLAKDREQRYQSAGDAAVDLRRLAASPDAVGASLIGEPATSVAQGATSAPEPRRSPLLLAGVALATLVVGAIGAWALKPAPDAVKFPGVEFNVVLAKNETFSSNYNRVATISPDSKTVAYTKGDGLTIRKLNDVKPIDIPGTDSARSPAFSPDGQQLVFWSGGHVKRLGIDERVPVVVGSFRERPMGMHWNADGFVYIGRANLGIWRMAITGGEAEQVLKLEPGEYAHGPELLPGGEWVLFSLTHGVRAWNSSSIVAHSLKTNERRELVARGREVRVTRNGFLTYVQEGTLFAIPFDIDRIEVTGGAVAMHEGVHTSALDETGAASYDISDDGVLAIAPPAGFSDRPVQLTFRDGDGNEEVLPSGVHRFFQFEISPDQTMIAAQVNEIEGAHIWLFPLRRGGGQRLTSEGRNTAPVWSSDGRYVYFSSDRDGEIDIWRRRADLSAPAEQLLDAEGAQIPTSASRDGEWLLYEQMAPSNSDVARVRLNGDPIVEVLVDSMADELAPSFSADGGFFCYQSDETGRWDIKVREIATGRSWIVSTEGGYSPRWSLNGNRIIYLNSMERVDGIDIVTTPEFKTSDPTQAFTTELDRHGRTFDITPDGSKLLVGITRETHEAVETRERITIVMGWFGELERRAR
jgi:serine/threonine-protein kinase